LRKGEIQTKTNEIEPKVRLLTIRQAARLIDGLTEYRIRQLCASGKLPCLMSGNKRLINEQTLIGYVTNPGNLKGANENE
jgi:excisionase family DNA binding protein